MFKTFFKLAFMMRLGFKYVKIFKQTYFDPFISYKPAYKQLSLDRQEYSNAILKYLNIDVKIVGELPQKDRMLYAINHRSLLDILVMENIFNKKNKNGTWIAKQELFDNPIYGNFFRYSGCISVDLENGRGLLKFFKDIKKVFKRVDDFNIYMFPEGERNKKDGVLEFQSGANKIAKANKLDIVPVFINDTLEEVFQEAPYKQTKTIEIHFGEIIEHKNLEEDYKTFMKKIKDTKSE